MGEGGASIRQGAFIREGRLIQTIHLKGASIRYGAFIGSFTVSTIRKQTMPLKDSICYREKKFFKKLKD